MKTEARQHWQTPGFVVVAFDSPNEASTTKKAAHESWPSPVVVDLVLKLLS